MIRSHALTANAPDLVAGSALPFELNVDRWMSDTKRVGAQVSSAWARHVRLPRWRYLPRPSASLAGAMILFCSDRLHPFQPDKPGYAEMCYGFPRDVIVLGVRRSDHAVLELVPTGAPESERALHRAALGTSDDALSAVLSGFRWRLSDSYRAFLVGWFAHGFGMAAIQHATVFDLMLAHTPERLLPRPRKEIEQQVSRREVRVMREARRRLLALLDRSIVRAVRASGAILTPAVYNFVATAPNEVARERRLQALASYPGLLPAVIAQDPPLPDRGAVDVLDYYAAGSEQEFPAPAQQLAALADKGRDLAPRLAERLYCSIGVVQAAAHLPALMFWRLGDWGLRALLRTIDAISPVDRPRRLHEWLALREIAFTVTALADAFDQCSERLGDAVWNGGVSRFLSWATRYGWTDAVDAVQHPDGLSSLTFGMEQSLRAERDVARAQGVSPDSALAELAKWSVPELLAWNQRWQRALDEHRQRVEKRTATSDE